MSEKGAWDFHNAEPLYLQLANRLAEKILSGWFQPGERFPTIRKLAQEAGVNTNTAERAYRVLNDENFIVKQKGRYRVNLSPEFIAAKRYEAASAHISDCMRHLMDLGYSENELGRELEIINRYSEQKLKIYVKGKLIER